MKMETLKNITLLFISIIVCLLLFESGIRVFIKPSGKCYGTLWGDELPPFKLKMGHKFHTNYDEEVADGVIISGKKMSKGDLWGISEEDPVMGYAPKKNAVSLNGLWQSNNWGARSRQDLSKNKPLDVQRIILFGDSFTNCSRISQEETWPFLLNDKGENQEFVNFGVDGYSMAQCLLRYESLKDQIDYDVVMLVVSPSTDLWRDINVLRQLGHWENYPLVPRFILKHDQLELVQSPYRTYEDLEKENASHVSEVLRKYLRAYDRLYFVLQYESPPFVGELISYKLFARMIYQIQSKWLFRYMMGKDSEAVRVSQKIFEKMDSMAKRDHKKFVLVYLPALWDVKEYGRNPRYRRHYDEMVSLGAKAGLVHIDLMGDFLNLETGQLDTAFDGAHYGPHANKTIAEILWKKLSELAIIRPSRSPVLGGSDAVLRAK